MLTLVVQDINSTVRVEYIIDGPVKGNFTIMEIRGLSNAEIRLGLPDKPIQSNYKVFTDLCFANGFKLIQITSAGIATTLVDNTDMYPNGGLGIDNI